MQVAQVESQARQKLVDAAVKVYPGLHEEQLLGLPD